MTRPIRLLTLILVLALFGTHGAAADHPTNVTLDSITLPNGTTLEYAESGFGKRRVVIFLHGYSDSYFSWSDVLPLLPPRFHAYALTQRGHGDSDKPATGYEMSDFADDVAAFMDALDIDKASIVGHSMGSVIAQRFAIDYPERVRKLVLVGAGADVDQNPVILDLLPFVETFVDPVDPTFVLDFQASTVFQPIAPEFLDTVVNESLKVPARVWIDALRGLANENTLSELDQIDAPTLIVWGDKDDIFPLDDQVELLEGIPNSRIEIYGDTGHGTHWERPERFATDLVKFLKRRPCPNND